MATNPLKKARLDQGLTAKEVAEKIGTHPYNYYRIERGEQVPRQDLARSMFKLFRGAVTIGQCYDPTFKQPRRRAA